MRFLLFILALGLSATTMGTGVKRSIICKGEKIYFQDFAYDFNRPAQPGVKTGTLRIFFNDKELMTYEFVAGLRAVPHPGYWVYLVGEVNVLEETPSSRVFRQTAILYKDPYLPSERKELGQETVECHEVNN
jgi:hypothetical protein